MNFIQTKKKVIEFIKENFSVSGKIIELKKKDDKWISYFELIEEDDYVRKFGKTDLVGLYEVELNDEGEVLGYKRILIRERTDINSSQAGE
jgi:hypothetical protein